MLRPPPLLSGVGAALRRPGAHSAPDAHALDVGGNSDDDGFVGTFTRGLGLGRTPVHVICHIYQLCQAAMQHATRPSRSRYPVRLDEAAPGLFHALWRMEQACRREPFGDRLRNASRAPAD